MLAGKWCLSYCVRSVRAHRRRREMFDYYCGGGSDMQRTQQRSGMSILFVAQCSAKVRVVYNTKDHIVAPTLVKIAFSHVIRKPIGVCINFLMMQF